MKILIPYLSPFMVVCRVTCLALPEIESYCWFARDVTVAMLVARTKAFVSSGTKIYYVNSSRKKSIVLTSKNKANGAIRCKNDY